MASTEPPCANSLARPKGGRVLASDQPVADGADSLYAKAKVANYWVSDNPDAINGPPIIGRNNLVINGNGRTMTLQLAAHNNDYQWYRDALDQKASQFGIDPAAYADMKHPVLVRAVDMTGAQRELYESIRVAAHAEVRQHIKTRGIGGSTIQILDALLKLRRHEDALASFDRAVCARLARHALELLAEATSGDRHAVAVDEALVEQHAGRC